MIRTQEEFTNACNFIDADMELYDFQLSEKMSSYEYNLYLQDTEYFLNFLYEKIRILEEMCDYLDHYTDTKILQTKQQVEADTTWISQVVDTYQDAVKTRPVWSRSQIETIMDRDGSSLPLAASDKNNVMAAARKEDIVQPQLIIKQGANNAYGDNRISAIKDDMYVTVYQTSSYTKNDYPYETVIVTLPENASFNCVDIEPIHCKLDVTKTEEGLKITMYPEGCDKEYRFFDFQPFTGSALDNVSENAFTYRSDQAIAENQQGHADIDNANATEQYLSNVVTAQTTMNTNQAKSNVIGAI